MSDIPPAKNTSQTSDLAPLNLAKFNDRDRIIAHIRDLCPYLPEDDKNISSVRGNRAHALERLAKIDPIHYAKTRNYIEGKVTRLSPYVRHGIITLDDIREKALSISRPQLSEKLIQQMVWREYWQGLYRRDPEIIWRDAEPYKTGFSADEYEDELPADIVDGATGVAIIDYFIGVLLSEGTMHNHARLYVAAYICHWRRIKWQAGARFFLSHLIDGDPASNNLSWQWIASTFSNKPYYYNLENVRKFSPEWLNTSEDSNLALTGSYEEIYANLFPNLEPK